MDAYVDQLVNLLKNATVNDNEGNPIPLKSLQTEGVRGAFMELVTNVRDHAQVEFEKRYQEETAATQHEAARQREIADHERHRNETLLKEVGKAGEVHAGTLRVLQEEIDQIRNTMTNGGNTTAPHRLDVKLGKPQPFSGSKKSQDAVDGFIETMENIFAFETRLNDAQKIILATTHFEDGKPASQWVRPFMRYLRTRAPETPDWMLTWESFSEELRAKFGDPFDKKTTYNKLCGLRQLGSARDYAIKFQDLAERTGMPTDLLMIQYEGYLKMNVRNSLAGRTFNNLTDLINASIQIDEALYANRQTASNTNTTTETPRTTTTQTATKNQPATQTTTTTNTGYTPMEVDTIRQGPRAPLSPEERRRRLINILCFVCADPNHQARECPIARNNRPAAGNRQVLAITDGTTQGSQTSFQEASAVNEAQ